MFELPDEKLFRDVIHGYIKVPRCFVENIIDTAMFQRLRNIDQTGMRVLYPDAKHDRFGHSLGVFHLGCQAVDALLDNFQNSSEAGKSKYWLVRSDDSLSAFWAKNKVLFLIACLLHDIGHAPFSHALENEMHANSGGRDFDAKLAELLGVEYSELAKQKCAPHEKMGAYLVFKCFKDPIKLILDYLKAKNFPRRHQSALTIEPKTEKSYVNADEIDEDIRFIARSMLGLKYTSPDPEDQIRNCFIDLLNGNNFDVDKLDYIMRDTQASGMKNTGIDVERLLGAIDIVTQTEYRGGIEELFNERTLIQTIKSGVLEKNSAEVNINGYVDGALVLKTGAEVEIRQNSTIAEMRKHGDDEAKIRGTNDTSFLALSNHAHVNLKNNEKLVPHQGGKPSTATASLDELKEAPCFIKDVSVGNDTGAFKFSVTNGEFALILKGFCDIKITGKFANESPLIIGSPGNIKGDNLQATIVGNKIETEIPRPNKYNSFAVGFKKSAVSNISAVLDARDNLYKWIYAHHKVMYYANFLIPTVAQGTREIRDKLSCPTDGTGIKVDDAFIWTHVSHQYHSRRMRINPEIKPLMIELMNRTYKKSLYKSLPEYDVLFEKLTIDQKKAMTEKFQTHIENNDEKPNAVVHTNYLDENGEILQEPRPIKVAGFVKRDLLDGIMRSIDDDSSEIANLVWLAAQYKEKKLDLGTTYLIYKDATTTLSRIDLLSHIADLSSGDTSYYFYLFFDIAAEQDESAEDRRSREDRIRKKLSEAIVNYFSKGV